MNMNLTKQGVLDLNGPHANGTGYNGHKSASCPHHRAPDLVPTHRATKPVIDAYGFPTTKNMVCCSNCGVELYEVG